MMEVIGVLKKGGKECLQLKRCLENTKAEDWTEEAKAFQLKRLDRSTTEEILSTMIFS